ncbi:MAG TPA: transposase [Anaerolineae bacterium]|nr:transposase [Anaerolineae bacterium]
MSYYPTPTALFRYRVVSAIEALRMQGFTLADAVCAVADQEQVTPKGVVKQYSPRTLYRWRRMFALGGLAGLEPRKRTPLLGSRVIEPSVLDFLVREHKEDPHASIPELLRRARVQGVLRERQPLDRRAVWRAFRRLGLNTDRQRRPGHADVRRFSYAERMQMVLVDGCHFRAGPQRARRVAFYFLDDATRFGLEVVVGRSEHTEHFVQGLHALVRRFGLMDVLYSDNGSAFVSEDAARLLTNLGIRHITGTPHYPQGRGKVERFNRAVRARVLNGLTAADVDPSPASLTLRLRHDLLELYNHLPHASLENQTPQERWDASPRSLVPPRDEAWLTQCFVLTETRRVRLDNVIQYGGKLFEVPAGYAGKTLTLHRRLLEDNRLYIRHQERWLRLAELAPHFNATQQRAPSSRPSPEPASPHKNASMMDFERAYGSILSADGGFSDPNPDKE